MLIKPIAEIIQRINTIEFHESFDLIVAIGRGGIIPAALLQQRLGCDLEIIWVSFRDDAQSPLYDAPRLLRQLSFDPAGRRILLVDDRSQSGKTLAAAAGLLIAAHYIKSCVVNGAADYALFNENCFYFPWRTDIYPPAEV